MDYIFLVVISFYFCKGFIKGFISTLLSLITVFVVAVAAWKLVDVCLPYIQNVVQQPISNFICELLDGAIAGEFSSMEEFESAIANSKFSVFLIIKSLVGEIYFEGALTAGQILSPSLGLIATKVIVFVVLFFMLSLVVRIVKVLLKKIIMVCGLSVSDRVLGGVLGIAKGLIIFLILFSIMTAISNVILNEGLNNFLQGGQISKVVYNWLMEIIFKK